MRLGNEPADAATHPEAVADAGADVDAEAEAVILAEAEAAATAITAGGTSLLEVDLDDQTPAMGDSVHTYLKSIGRTSLLTAEQEVDLAKRIKAGLFAEHKLDTEPGPGRGLPA